ncbi:unnamed protein product [Gordionus sp. m RMFG-2023]
MEDHRRKWDKNEFEKKAYERLVAAEKEEDGDKPMIPFQRELLRPRDYKLNIESRIGKSIVVTKTTPVGNSGGYYCEVCDCVVKDSINFLDHVNGRKHIRNLGMSMKIERSTLNQVKERIEKHILKTEEVKKEYSFEQRLKELKQEEERLKARKKEKQLAKKLQKYHGNGILSSQSSDMAAIMGFGSFSMTTKK